MEIFGREKNRLIEVNRLLIKGRWLYISGIVLIGIASKVTSGFSDKIVDSPNSNFSPFLMVFLAFASYGLNLIFYWYFRKPEKISSLGIKIVSFLQLILDQIFYVFIIFFAGGLTSISFLYFFYNIIAAAFFYSFVGVLVISSIASLLYGSLILLQYFQVIPFFSRYNLAYEYALAFNYAAVVTNLIAIILSFYIVGMFAGLIARSLRKREEEIREERDKEKAILANLSDGLIFINREGVIEAVNAKAEKLLSFDSKKVFGRKIEKLDKNAFVNLFEIFKDKYKKKGEFKPIGESDEVLKIYTVPVLDEKKKQIGIVKVIHDISREKFVDKMKSEFIMIAGHQLRTPLSAIKSAFDLLLKGDFGKLAVKQKKVLDQCFVYNEKLINIVDDLLEIFSIEEGKYYYQFIKTDLRNLIEETSKRYQEAAKEKNIKFSLLVDKNLPEIKLDPYKIKLVLGSLIENAVTYTDRNGKVDVAASLKGDKVAVSVKDTGIGIPNESRGQVFSKFFRGGNALSFHPDGNGLGLFVAKNIIEYHEGKIWFESEMDKGTTFYVELPIDTMAHSGKKNEDLLNLPKN
ncbi:MAG: ATP-binding protein [Patescibacteria group bacterium]